MTTAVINVIIIPIEENRIPLALPGVLLTGSVVPLVKGVSVVPLVTVASVVVLLVTVASVVVLLITGASVVVLLITGSSVVVLLVIGASVVVLLLGATVGDAVSFNTWIFQPRFKWVAHYS